MRPVLSLLLIGVASAGSVQAQGLLVPTQRDVPPLALSAHEVKVTIEDQVAVTHVAQTFRNHTSRALEATYIFPVPKGASVKRFTMWVDGKETPGELVEADKARSIYTDIVNRTKDPGLLEYMDNNLLKVRVFPVPAHGEQKLTVSYTSLAQSDNGLIEFIYPLKAGGNVSPMREPGKFSFEATLKAQQPIQNVYSPTHAINVRRPNDREAVVRFEGKQETLGKDFQLYYSAASKDVGLTAIVHRNPSQRADKIGKDGYFMMLISPRAELSKTQQVPRDMVFVLDTSGSMSGKRIEQARNALKFCLRNLNAKDRFAVIHFATTVNKYQDQLQSATSENIAKAQKWVENLEAVGATNIDGALAEALAMRPAPFPSFRFTSANGPIGSAQGQTISNEDFARSFTVVFFTDGEPTIGETDPQKIVKNVMAKNTANTRIFTFGVGDDVNAVLLDQLAEKTRSVSTYVRESEDIEAKVSNFYSKISHPVMTNLKLKFGKDVAVTEVYPPQLPDLFHGSQLVVLGRYKTKPSIYLPVDWEIKETTTVTLEGMVGGELKEFNCDVNFHEKSNDKAFVEDLWARRKVGFLLDQIRTNGENKELEDEVVMLAKKYGITTPYTSYLVVPDTAPRAANALNPQVLIFNKRGLQTPACVPVPLPSPSPSGADVTSGTLPPTSTGSTAPARPSPYGYGAYADRDARPTGILPLNPALNPWMTDLPATNSPSAQTGKDGVDLAQQLEKLRNQERVTPAFVREAAGRKLMNVNGVWLCEGVDAKMPVVRIKAQSEAYFRMLKLHREMREVFQLGNQVIWVTPSQTVLVIGPVDGEERMTDAAIERLFVVKK